MADTGDTRAERLKAALRDNLRRRKVQERDKERGKAQGNGPDAVVPPPRDDSPVSDASGAGPDSDKTRL